MADSPVPSRVSTRGAEPLSRHCVDTPNSDIENGKIKPNAPPAQLYDLEADRGQTTNLYHAKPDIAAEMAALLKSYRNAAPPTSETTKQKKRK